MIELNRNRRHLTKFQRIELEYKLEIIEYELAKKRISDAGRKGLLKDGQKRIVIVILMEM